MNIHRKNVFEHNVCTLYYIVIIVGSMQRRIMQGELQNETAIQQINARLLKSQIVCFNRGGKCPYSILVLHNMKMKKIYII